MSRAALIVLTLLAAPLEARAQLGDLIGSAVEARERLHISDEDELQVARHTAQAIEDSAAMWDDPLLDAYLAGLVQRLVTYAPPRPYPYRIRVIETPILNAFAVGGGFLYVHSGLLARLENEAQLAFVLGHEIAHVAERHLPERIEKSAGIGLLAQAGAVAAGGAMANELFRRSYETAITAAVMGYSRETEEEADEEGLDYLARAGWDPREAARFFEILLEDKGDPSPLVTFFYGSHPRLVSRIEHVSERVQQKYRDRLDDGPTVGNPEFDRRTAAVVLSTGIAEYEARRYRTARSLFEKAARVSVADPATHYWLGRVELETGPDVSAAIAHLERAVSIDPEYAPPHLQLGLAHYRRGAIPAAREAFERYLELAPGADDASRARQMIRDLDGP